MGNKQSIAHVLHGCNTKASARDEILVGMIFAGPAVVFQEFICFTVILQILSVSKPRLVFQRIIRIHTFS